MVTRRQAHLFLALALSLSLLFPAALPAELVRGPRGEGPDASKAVSTADASPQALLPAASFPGLHPAFARLAEEGRLPGATESFLAALATAGIPASSPRVLAPPASATPLRDAILAWNAASRAKEDPAVLATELARADAMPLPAQNALASLVVAMAAAQASSPEDRAQAVADLVATAEAATPALQAFAAGSERDLERRRAMEGAIDALAGSRAGAGAASDLGTIMRLVEAAASYRGVSPLPQPPAPEGEHPLMAVLARHVASEGTDEPHALMALARADAFPLEFQRALAAILEATVVEPGEEPEEATLALLGAVRDGLPVLEKWAHLQVLTDGQALAWHDAELKVRLVEAATLPDALTGSVRGDAVLALRQLGIMVPPAVPAREPVSLPEAMASLYDAAGVEPTEDLMVEVARRSNGLPGAFSLRVAGIVAAAADVARASQAMDAAVSDDEAGSLAANAPLVADLLERPGITQSELGSLRAMTPVVERQHGAESAFLQAGLEMLSAVDALLEVVAPGVALPSPGASTPESHPQVPIPGATGDFVFVDPLGLVVIGGQAPTTYDAATLRGQAAGVGLANPVGPLCAGRGPPEQVLTIDLGGNDVYRNNAGGTMGDRCGRASAPADRNAFGLSLGVAVAIDLAGDDLYETPPGGRNHTQGAAVNGLGLLVDVEGNDRYAANSGSQGASFVGPPASGRMGLGLLFDLAGDDVYEAGRSSQGAGNEQSIDKGRGVLLDLSGDDRYVARETSQGFLGLLADLAGDDLYSAGARSQGYDAGLLLDAGGQDRYAGNPQAKGRSAEDSVPPDAEPLVKESSFLDARRNNAVWIDGDAQGAAIPANEPDSTSDGIGIDVEPDGSSEDALLRDEDSDRFHDFLERELGTDPRNATNTPLSILLFDRDGDGYADDLETALKSDPSSGADYPAGLPRDAPSLAGVPYGGDKLLQLPPIIAIGDVVPTTFTRDVVFAMDLRGDDQYRMNAGGRVNTTQGVLSGAAASLPLANRNLTVAIDLGGSDRYESPDRTCVQGCGGLLLDTEGSDRYTAATGQGRAVYLDPNDKSTMRPGILLDAQGNDAYTLSGDGQGFVNGTEKNLAPPSSTSREAESASAFAVLLDSAGDDVYRGKGQGVVEGHAVRRPLPGGPGGERDMASGGFVVFADLAGSDRYVADTSRDWGRIRNSTTNGERAPQSFALFVDLAGNQDAYGTIASHDEATGLRNNQVILDGVSDRQRASNASSRHSLGVSIDGNLDPTSQGPDGDGDVNSDVVELVAGTSSASGTSSDPHERAVSRPSIGTSPFADTVVLNLPNLGLGVGNVVDNVGTSSWRRDYALLVELGGNDSYTNDAAGRGFNPQGVEFAGSFLLDVAGDDTYRSTREETIGVGREAFGVLLDLEGADVYQGAGHQYTIGVGAGKAAIGAVLDLEGNDAYYTQKVGIGAFRTSDSGQGSGMVVDVLGQDFYTQADPGASKSDRYSSGSLLVDLAECDFYRLKNDPAVGSPRALDLNTVLDTIDTRPAYTNWPCQPNATQFAANDRYFIVESGQNAQDHAGGFIDLPLYEALTQRPGGPAVSRISLPAGRLTLSGPLVTLSGGVHSITGGPVQASVRLTSSEASTVQRVDYIADGRVVKTLEKPTASAGPNRWFNVTWDPEGAAGTVREPRIADGTTLFEVRVYDSPLAPDQTGTGLLVGAASQTPMTFRFQNATIAVDNPPLFRFLEDPVDPTTGGIRRTHFSSALEGVECRSTGSVDLGTPVYNPPCTWIEFAATFNSLSAASVATIGSLNLSARPPNAAGPVFVLHDGGFGPFDLGLWSCGVQDQLNYAAGPHTPSLHWRGHCPTGDRTGLAWVNVSWNGRDHQDVLLPDGAYVLSGNLSEGNRWSTDTVSGIVLDIDKTPPRSEVVLPRYVNTNDFEVDFRATDNRHGVKNVTLYRSIPALGSDPVAVATRAAPFVDPLIGAGTFVDRANAHGSTIRYFSVALDHANNTEPRDVKNGEAVSVTVDTLPVDIRDGTLKVGGAAAPPAVRPTDTLRVRVVGVKNLTGPAPFAPNASIVLSPLTEGVAVKAIPVREVGKSTDAVKGKKSSVYETTFTPAGSGVADARYAYAIAVTDLAGNAAVTEARVLIVDGTPPAIDVGDRPVAYPGSRRAAIPGDLLSLTLRVVDPGAGVERVDVDVSALSTADAVRLTRVAGTDLYTGTFTFDRNVPTGWQFLPVVTRDLLGNEARCVSAGCDGAALVPVRIVREATPIADLAHTADHRSATVTFRTAEPTRARVAYSDSPLVLDSEVAGTDLLTEHSVVIPGLKPNTTYSYAVDVVNEGGFRTTTDFSSPRSVRTANALAFTAVPSFTAPLQGVVDVAWTVAAAPGANGTAPRVQQKIALSRDGGTTFLPLDAFDADAGPRTFRLDTAGHPDGDRYVLRLTGVNLDAPADVVQARVGPLVFDNSGPEVLGIEPSQPVADPRPLIEVAFREAFAGIDASTIAFELDGTPVPPELVARNATHARFRPSVELGEGRHIVTFRANDVAGNAVTKRLPITIDLTPPLLDVRTPSYEPGPLAARAGSAVTFEATARDLVDRVASVSVVTAGIATDPILGLGPAARDHDFRGRTTLKTGVPDGVHELVLTASDVAGNSRTATLRVRVDNTPPSPVTEGRATVDAAYTSATLTIFANEPVRGVLAFGKSGQPLSGSAASEALAERVQVRAEGLFPTTTYAYVLRIIDGAGNEYAEEGVFATLADDVPPRAVTGVTILDAQDGRLVARWDPAVDNVAVASYRVERADAPTGPWAVVGEPVDGSFEDAGLTLGRAYWYRVRALDHTGNVGEPSPVVSGRSRAPPVLSGWSVSPSKGDAGAVYTFRVTYRSPQGDAPSAVRVIVDGTPFTMQRAGPGTGDHREGVEYAFSTKLAPVRLSSGSHTYRFEATDGVFLTLAPASGAFQGPVVVERAASEGAGIAQFLAVPGSSAPALLLAAVAAALLVSGRRRWFA